MTVQDLVSLVQGVGFPIFVAVYLLVFFNTTIQENTKVIRDLTKFLEGKTSNGGLNGQQDR